MRAAAILLTSASPAAETEDRIAIFKDDIPPSGAASSPDHLADLLQKSGLVTAFLKSEQLAAARELNHDRFDALVLPYGASFPVDAANNFRQFLHAGGKFLSTGGYAFDHLLTRTTNGWRAYQPPAAPKFDGAAWFYDIPAAELGGHGLLTFRGFLKTDSVTGPGFAHFSVYQVAADGSLPTWRDVCQVHGTEDWKEHRFAFEVHPQAATVSLRAGLYRCRGSAWFDDVRVTDEAGKVLLEADFEQPLPLDQPGPNRWWRSHQKLCVRQSTVAHAGSNALKATLSLVALLDGSRPVMTNFLAITANLKNPKGSLGDWLLPTNVTPQLSQTLATANTTLGSANTTLVSANTLVTNSDAYMALLVSNLNLSLVNVAALTSNLHRQVEVNSNLVTSVNRAIVDTDDMVQGLKRHWLLRSAFKTNASAKNSGTNQVLPKPISRR